MIISRIKGKDIDSLSPSYLVSQSQNVVGQRCIRSFPLRRRLSPRATWLLNFTKPHGTLKFTHMCTNYANLINVVLSFFMSSVYHCMYKSIFLCSFCSLYKYINIFHMLNSFILKVFNLTITIHNQPSTTTSFETYI